MARNREGKAFEKKLEQLEKTIERLESGETTLEESLKLFEEGTVMIKDLADILEKVEKKVDILTRETDGSLKKTPFQAAGQPGKDDGEIQE